MATTATKKKEVVDWEQGMGLKDSPNVGTTRVFQINNLTKDLERPGTFINYAKHLAVFPAAINRLYGTRLAKDGGFDTEEEANELRRIIYYGKFCPEKLTDEERADLEKIVADDRRWKDIGSIYDKYQELREDYFKKSAGIV